MVESRKIAVKGKRKTVLLLVIILNITYSFAFGLKDSSSFKVSFDLNYDGAPEINSIAVKNGGVIAVKNKPFHERKGYRLAGWYTSKNPKLVNGISDEEWLFGEQKIPMFSAFGAKDNKPNSMLVNADITLYARWVMPVNIKSAKNLQLLRQDLKGWYVLQNDIDLKNVEWKPIGFYDASYEFSDPNWWQMAFQGVLDGNHHTLKNLSIHQPQNTAAFFGAVANAIIKNIIIDNYHIEYDLTDNENVQGSYLYAAPLIGFMHGITTVSNCHTRGIVNVKTTDSKSEMTYASAAGIAAGAWGGEINGCTAKGKIIMQTKSNNGGEIHAAGFVGEGYNTTINCKSKVVIICRAISKAIITTGKGDNHLEIFAGGINAASTYVMNCVANGSIEVSLSKPKGDCSINVGGISGSERYGFIENCASHVDIKVNDGRKVYAGGILGSFSRQYGLIGLALGVKRYEATHCYTTGKITIAQNFKRDSASVHLGGIISEIPKEIVSDYLPGKRMPMNYKVESCSYVNYYKKKILSDSNGNIKSFESLMKMKGDSLKDSLGNEQWEYVDNRLPLPKMRPVWSLK